MSDDSTIDQPLAPALAWGAATDTGRVRTENEDTFVALPMVFGVADGMGGHQAGEVASAIAARTLHDRLTSGAHSVDVVVAAVVEANASIFQSAHGNAEQRGMGTTLTALVVLTDPENPERLALVNVGDSRTYLVRNGRLRRVTIDHSYVQELVSTGHITEHEARSHPRRNIVTRALGIEPHVRVDTWVLPFVQGDRYVLCSDGLVDEVDDDEISAIIAANADPQAAAEALVASANEHGGRDNVTVVVVDVLDGDVLPPDAVDLDLDLDWDDQGHDRLVDAEAGITLAATPAATMDAAVASGPATAVLPVQPSPSTPPPTKRRFGLGGLLFGLAFGLIAMLTIVLVLVVRENANKDDDPSPTTTSTPVTTSSTPTSTTVRTTTTPPTTASVTVTTGP